MTIAGTGNYTGSLSSTFEIVSHTIDDASVRGLEQSFVYTGQPIEPSITLAAEDGTILEEGVDYELSFSLNTDAGTAVIQITGIGYYAGKRRESFTIAPAVLEQAEIRGIQDSYPFTGYPITPEPSVVCNGQALKKDVDYTLAWSNNINAGSALLVVTGNGNYSGTKTVRFSIIQAPQQPQPDPGKPDVPTDKPQNPSDKPQNKPGDSSNSQTPSQTPGDTSQKPDTKETVMYRLYNPNSGEHFYTKDASEQAYLARIGWKQEGIGWKVPEYSSTPVYRLYNPNAGDHHYTPDKKERKVLIELGWKDEGIGWYSADQGGLPLYRQYNPNAKTGNHNYTLNADERDMLVKKGWNDEGIGWYALR